MFDNIKTLDDFDLKDKKILLRLDLNSPIDEKTGELLDDRRFILHSDTIKELHKKGAKIVIITHQGRPEDNDFTTLEKHAERLSKVTGCKIEYVEDIFGFYAREKIKKMSAGDIIMLENVRFFSEENTKRPVDVQAKTFMVQKLYPLVDIFVNDAFSVSHRSQPSVVGFTKVLPSCMGRLLEKELMTLGKVIVNPKRPVTFILAGAKADASFRIMTERIDNIDYILTGGIISHIFLAAEGYNLGEPTMVYIKGKGLDKYIEMAKELIRKYNGKILRPVDVALLSESGKRFEIPVSDLPKNVPIYDIGSSTIEKYSQIIKNSGTVFAHATMGMIENKEFRYGTEKIMRAVADSDAFSIIGGGHTIASARDLNIDSRIGYMSSGGGAAVTFLGGEKLPGVEAIRSAAGVKSGAKQ